MGQKLSSKLLFRSSPNTDGNYTFYVSQGSVATQLRCGGMFSNHFTTNYSQNAAVKKIWKSVNIWQRYGNNFVAYFFGSPCIVLQTLQFRRMTFGLRLPRAFDSIPAGVTSCCRKTSAAPFLIIFRTNEKSNGKQESSADAEKTRDCNCV